MDSLRPRYRYFLCASLVASLSACAPFALRAPDPDPEQRRAIESAHHARIDGQAGVRIAGRMLLRLQPGLTYIPPAQGERNTIGQVSLPRVRVRSRRSVRSSRRGTAQ